MKTTLICTASLAGVLMVLSFLSCKKEFSACRILPKDGTTVFTVGNHTIPSDYWETKTDTNQYRVGWNFTKTEDLQQIMWQLSLPPIADAATASIMIYFKGFADTTMIDQSNVLAVSHYYYFGKRLYHKFYLNRNEAWLEEKDLSLETANITTNMYYGIAMLKLFKRQKNVFAFDICDTTVYAKRTNKSGYRLENFLIDMGTY